MGNSVSTLTATQANSTSITISKPSQTTAGMLLLVQVVSNDQAVTPPSGWTKFQDSAVDIFRMQQFRKVAGSSEPSSYTFTVQSPAPLVLVQTLWSGYDQVNPIGDANHPTQTALSHSEPYTTPTVSNDADTAGRMIYIRASRRANSSTPITFSTTASGVTESADVGVFSGGNVAYSIALYKGNADFTTAGSHPGIPITANPSFEDTHNIVSTIALTATAAFPAPAPNPADSIYQRIAHSGAASLLAGESLIVIADGEPGDPVLGGGFQVHRELDFETDVASDDYVVLYSRIYEEAPGGRQGWVSKIRATADMTDVGLATFAVLMRRNPIIPE